MIPIPPYVDLLSSCVIYTFRLKRRRTDEKRNFRDGLGWFIMTIKNLENSLFSFSIEVFSNQDDEGNTIATNLHLAMKKFCSSIAYICTWNDLFCSCVNKDIGSGNEIT